MMGTLTPTDVLDIVSSLVASEPFAFTRALEPFSFRLQPQQNVDRTFCLLTEMDEYTGYLGMAQAEIDRLTLRLARRIAFGGADDAVRLLLADCSSMQSAIIRDGLLHDYSGEVVRFTLQSPGEQDAYAIGELEITVDYDRAL
jgi:hypothetical protein